MVGPAGLLALLVSAPGIFYTFSAFGNYVYTTDMANNPTLVQRSADPGDGTLHLFNNVFFENRGGQIVVHRADKPSITANIVGPSNVTTLNGVLHRVDNLLK